MLKGLNDFMDKHEGREIGSSTKAVNKERERQGYKAKSKVLEGKKKETKRYQAAPMPDEYMSHEDKVKYYKEHKGKMVSNKVNPKTGKYFNTY